MHPRVLEALKYLLRCSAQFNWKRRVMVIYSSRYVHLLFGGKTGRSAWRTGNGIGEGEKAGVGSCFSWEGARERAVCHGIKGAFSESTVRSWQQSAHEKMANVINTVEQLYRQTQFFFIDDQYELTRTSCVTTTLGGRD